MLTWFYGLSVVPIAQASALSFTAEIFGPIGAALVLGERVCLRRWSAVVAGFIGVLVILRPGFGEADPAALVVVLSSICSAAALLTVKRLSTTDSVVCVVTWNSVLLTVLSLPVAIPVWVTPSTEQVHRKFKRRFSSTATLSRCQRVVNRVRSW